MKYTLILSALLALGAGMGASAAPKHSVHKKHLATIKPAPQALPAAPAARAVRPLPGGFPDVPADHWAARAVETLRQRGIVTGYPASAK